MEWAQDVLTQPGSALAWHPWASDLKVPHGHRLHQAHKRREVDKSYHFHVGKVWYRSLFKATEWVSVKWGTKSWSWFTCFWLWDKAPSQAEGRSQDSLLCPTDQCCWSPGISAMTSDLFWQKGQLAKADASSCLVSVASKLSVLSHYSVQCCRQVECFLGFDIAALHIMKATLQMGLLRYGNL